VGSDCLLREMNVGTRVKLSRKFKQYVCRALRGEEKCSSVVWHKLLSGRFVDTATVQYCSSVLVYSTWDSDHYMMAFREDELTVI